MSSKETAIEMEAPAGHFCGYWRQADGKPSCGCWRAARGEPDVFDVQPSPDVNLMLSQNIERYLKYGVPLYQAALKGNWKAAQKIIDSNNDLICARITKKQDTALHIAAAANHVNFVTQLVCKMHKDNLTIANLDGNTALAFAAASGNVDIAKVMIKANSKLPVIRSRENMTPLHMAALLGNKAMVQYLRSETCDEEFSSTDRINLLISTINADMYDIAFEIFMKDRSLALKRNLNDESALHALARRPLKSNGNETSTWKRWRNKLTGFNKPQPQPVVLQLVQGLWKEVIKGGDTAISEFIGRPRGLLFDAAEVGNAEFLATLIQSYPDLLWTVNEEKYSIYHVAILNRQEKIFNMIYDIGAIKDILATFKDNQGNNMLHLAAKSPPLCLLQCVSGAALQMQRELLWFKVVKEMFPQYAEAQNECRQELLADQGKEVRKPQYAEAQNECRQELLANQGKEVRKPVRDGGEENGNMSRKDSTETKTSVTPQPSESKKKSGQTPQALFTETHEELRKQGEDWMKNTANYCMVVAALIITVVFTAAFTVPGGNDVSSGTPILLHKVAFKVFAISDAISLVASSASLLMFLSILTSRYAEQDFLRRLPLKLMLGLTCLFVSIATMMVAFTATYFIIFKNGSKWAAPIASLACIPVVLFCIEQYSLLRDICQSTFTTSYLFGSNKLKLY